MRQSRKRGTTERSAPPAAPPAELATPRDESGEEIYSFPTRSRCPRCGSVNTVSTSTDGKYQYRVCRSSVCRHKFRVVGTLV